MRELRVLVDTNVFLVGVVHVAQHKESDERKIIDLMLSGKIKTVVTITLLEEYTRVAKREFNKDFAGWLRHLLVENLKPVFVDEAACAQLEKYVGGLVPEEDLRHFVSCIIGGVDYLISENREFIKKAKNARFACLGPHEFLRELERLPSR